MGGFSSKGKRSLPKNIPIEPVTIPLLEYPWKMKQIRGVGFIGENLKFMEKEPVIYR